AGDYTASASFAGDANHTSSSDSKNFTIFKRDATWTTNDSGKLFGDPDPSPLTTGSGTFLAGDGVTATYTRALGENVGPYHITATLQAAPGVLANYNITNAGGTFTIGQNSSTTTVTWTDGASTTYDGNPHTATASVTGAGGLNQGLPVSYEQF